MVAGVAGVALTAGGADAAGVAAAGATAFDGAPAGTTALVDADAAALAADAAALAAGVVAVAAPIQVLTPLWPEQAPAFTAALLKLPSLHTPVVPAGAPAGACASAAALDRDNIRDASSKGNFMVHSREKIIG